MSLHIRESLKNSFASEITTDWLHVNPHIIYFLIFSNIIFYSVSVKNDSSSYIQLFLSVFSIFNLIQSCAVGFYIYICPTYINYIIKLWNKIVIFFVDALMSQTQFEGVVSVGSRNGRVGLVWDERTSDPLLSATGQPFEVLPYRPENSRYSTQGDSPSLLYVPVWKRKM